MLITCQYLQLPGSICGWGGNEGAQPEKIKSKMKRSVTEGRGSHVTRHLFRCLRAVNVKRGSSGRNSWESVTLQANTAVQQINQAETQQGKAPRGGLGVSAAQIKKAEQTRGKNRSKMDGPCRQSGPNQYRLQIDIFPSLTFTPSDRLGQAKGGGSGGGG